MAEQLRQATEQQLTALKVGDIVYYRLPPWMRPVSPAQEWYGVVTYVARPYDRLAGCLVQLLEPGYEGSIDWVTPPFIAHVKPKEEASVWDRIGCVAGELRMSGGEPHDAK